MSAKTPENPRTEKGHSRDNVGILSREALTAKGDRNKYPAPKDTVLNQADGAGDEEHPGADA